MLSVSRFVPPLFFSQVLPCLHTGHADTAKDQVIENGYDPVYGARPLKRYLQKYVETLAARKILSGDVHAGDTLVLDVQNGEFIVTVKDGN